MEELGIRLHEVHGVLCWRWLELAGAPLSRCGPSAAETDLKWHVEVRPAPYQTKQDLGLHRDMTLQRTCCSVAQWWVPDAHTCSDLAVAGGLEDMCMAAQEVAVVAVDIYVAEAAAFSELPVAIEPFSSCAAQYLLLAWLDKKILCRHGRPSR